MKVHNDLKVSSKRAGRRIYNNIQQDANYNDSATTHNKNAAKSPVPSATEHSNQSIFLLNKVPKQQSANFERKKKEFNQKAEKPLPQVREHSQQQQKMKQDALRDSLHQKIVNDNIVEECHLTPEQPVAKLPRGIQNQSHSKLAQQKLLGVYSGEVGSRKNSSSNRLMPEHSSNFDNSDFKINIIEDANASGQIQQQSVSALRANQGYKVAAKADEETSSNNLPAIINGSTAQQQQRQNPNDFRSTKASIMSITRSKHNLPVQTAQYNSSQTWSEWPAVRVGKGGKSQNCPSRPIISQNQHLVGSRAADTSQDFRERVKQQDAQTPQSYLRNYVEDDSSMKASQRQDLSDVNLGRQIKIMPSGENKNRQPVTSVQPRKSIKQKDQKQMFQTGLYFKEVVQNRLKQRSKIVSKSKQHMNSIDSSSLLSKDILFEKNDEEVLFHKQMHQNNKHSYNQQTINVVEEELTDSLHNNKKVGMIVMKQLAQSENPTKRKEGRLPKNVGLTSAGQTKHYQKGSQAINIKKQRPSISDLQSLSPMRNKQQTYHTSNKLVDSQRKSAIDELAQEKQFESNPYPTQGSNILNRVPPPSLIVDKQNYEPQPQKRRKKQSSDQHYIVPSGAIKAIHKKPFTQMNDKTGEVIYSSQSHAQTIVQDEISRTFYSPYSKKSPIPKVIAASSNQVIQPYIQHQQLQQYTASKPKTGLKALKQAQQAHNQAKNFNNIQAFERLAQEQVRAFCHSGKIESAILSDQFADMISKNALSLADFNLSSRQLVKGNPVLRNSLKNKSMEQMMASRHQIRPASTQDDFVQQYATLEDPEHTVESFALAESKKQAELKMLATPQMNKNILTAQLKKQNTVVLSIRSQDKWFKRAAEAKGWVVNPGSGSLMFNVKWEYSETNKDVYKTLRNNQFYNHFPDSRELTTKQGLNQNLNSCNLPGVDIYSFYPRCYDLSDQRQVDLFQDDFNRTAILACLKKHAQYFKRQCRDIIKEIEAKDKLILQNKFMDERKRQLKRSFIGKFPPQGSIKKINTILLRNAIFYARNLLLQTTQNCEGEEFIKRDFYEPTFKFNQKILNLLVKYSEMQLPIDPEKTIANNTSLVPLEATIESLQQSIAGNDKKVEVKLRHVYADIFKFRGWEIPNVYVMYQAYKMHKELKRSYHQYGNIDGSDNIWISKPSFTARGVGIFCFRSLSELFGGSNKKQMCPKIVQKYVERSFLLDKHQIPQLDNSGTTIEPKKQKRTSSISPQKVTPTKKVKPQVTQDANGDMRKFDLRQWVYVNSFDPMRVFIYKKAYLRICGSHFDLTKFQDAQRHISNFSIQKDHELVLSSDDFIEYLKMIDPVKYGEISWENFFLPQVDQIVKQTLTQVAEVIESRLNSFELFGFDFVVDKDLKLWLIEVNMSPACAERQPWLTSMLDDMATGVVNLIQSKVTAYRESFENQITLTHGQTSVQDYNNNLKLYNKLQRKYMLEAITGTQWTPMSDVDGFYLQRGEGTIKVKIPQSQTVSQVNPSQFEKFNLELVGRTANIRLERAMDKMCQRIASIQFIQKVFRGYLVRKALHQRKQHLFKESNKRKKAMRVILENIELAEDRANLIDKREEPFYLIKMLYYDQLLVQIEQNPDKLQKVKKIQQVVKQWLSASRLETAQRQDEDVTFLVDEVVIEEEDNDETIILTGIRKTKIIDVLDQTEIKKRDLTSTRQEFPTESDLITDKELPKSKQRNTTSINFQQDHRIVQRSNISRNSLRSHYSSGASQNFQNTIPINKMYEEKKEMKPNPRHPSTTQRPPQYQLDSYLLLDYKAVGVELFVPYCEVKRRSKINSHSNSALYGSSSKKQSHNQTVAGNNYIFTPRNNCQENQLVTTGYINGKPVVEKSMQHSKDNEGVKGKHWSKKVKNQILQAYVDNKVRIKPLKM